MVGLHAKIAREFANFARNERGATSIEYALIASGIFLAILLAVGSLSSTMTVMYDDISDKVTTAVE